MKKREKKLVLAKETVRGLQGERLGPVGGAGTGSDGCVVSADPQTICLELFASERTC